MLGLSCLILASIVGSIEASEPLEPERPLALAVARAEEALRQQEPHLAESEFRFALEEGWLLLGSIDYVEGRFSEALARFGRARESVADPRRGDVARALTRLRQGEAGEAARILRELVVRLPGEVTSRRLLARALIADGRLPEAVQELEEARATRPEDPETLYALAALHLRSGNHDRARELFLQLTRQQPGAATWVLVGRTYRDYRVFDRAREALERALREDPDARRAYYYLGTVALAESGHDALEEAIHHFTQETLRRPQDPLSHLHLGMALVEARRCAEAVPALHVATRDPATASSARRFLGTCHLQANRNEEAAAELDHALRLADEDTRTRELHSIHYQLAVALRRLGRPEADRHFEVARELSSELVETERGEMSSFFGDLPEDRPLELVSGPVASSELLASFSSDEIREIEGRTRATLGRVYSNLGTLLARASEFDRAADLFARGVEVDPDSAPRRRSLGTALFRAGRHREAIDPLKEAVARDPGDRDAARMLALSLGSTGDHPRVTELLADDPARGSDPALQYAYALALLRTGHTEAAREAFASLLSDHPARADLAVLLGQAYAQQGAFPAAIESLRRALELDPGVAGAHGTLGDIYLRQGRLEEAENELRAELDSRPDAHESHYRLAVVLDLNRRSAEAEDELRRVLTHRPNFADARYLLGKITLGAGRLDEARLHLEAAAALAPTDPNVRYQLARAYQRLGDTERARAEFQTYRELKAESRGGTP